MLREHLKRQGRADAGFVWRGEEVSRLEGFIDAAFAFAVTLLVASLDPPKTYEALMVATRGLLAFAVCFAILFMLWHEHFRFSRRYGLQDGVTHVLSAVLVFVVLFYVYPLRFLFVSLTDAALGFVEHLPDGAIAYRVSPAQTASVMTLYGCGFTAVFAVLSLLYVHAWRQRESLGLTPVEQVRTREGMVRNALLALLGLVATGLAVVGDGQLAGVGGMVYFLIPVVHTVMGFRSGAEIRRLTQQAAEPA